MGSRIFVGNLPYSSTESDLRSHFAMKGVVNECKIMIDRETGRSRGFAFVTMAQDGDAARAIEELNGVEFLGRRLIVNEARDRNSAASPGTGFRSPRPPPPTRQERPVDVEYSSPRPSFHAQDNFPPPDFIDPGQGRNRSRRFNGNDRRRNRDDFEY